jgi:putative oxidoreductase
MALLFAIQGVLKLMGSPAWVHRFQKWGYPAHFYLLVGLTEIVGAVLLLIPGAVRLGAMLLMVVMLGATATHLLHHEPQVVTTLVLLAVLSSIVYLRSQLGPQN